MNKAIEIGLALTAIGTVCYFLFFKKSKKEQLAAIILQNGVLKQSLTEKEVEQLKELLLKIEKQTELQEWQKAFEELQIANNPDFFDTIESLLPESAQIAVLADWSEKGIINIDSISQEEKETENLTATFTEKIARKQHDLSEVGFNTAASKTLLKAITEDYKIMFNENTLKVTDFEEINEVDPYWTAEQIQTLLKNPKYRKYVCDDCNQNAPEYQLVKIIFEPLEERIKMPINNNVVYVSESEINKIKNQDYE